MKISIGKKISISFVIILVLMITMGIMAYYSLSEFKQAADELRNEFEKMTHIDDLKRPLLEALVINDYYVTGDIEKKGYFDILSRTVEDAIRQLEESLHLGEDEKSYIEGIKRNFAILKGKSDQMLKFVDPTKKEFVGPLVNKLVEEVDAVSLALVEDIEKFHDYIENEISEAGEDMERAKIAGTYAIIATTMLAILLAITIGIMLTRGITRPVSTLTASAKLVARGDLSQEIEVKSHDEIGDLSAAFNSMVSDLRESRAQLVDKDYVESIIANTIDTLIVFDAEGRMKTVNRATLDLLGYTEKELIGQPVRNIFAMNEDFFKEAILRRLFKEGFIGNYEVVYKTKHKKLIPMLFSGALMRSKSRELMGIVVIAKDITERKRTEKALETAYIKLKETQAQLIQEEKMGAVGRLASGIAHEVKNPLAIMLTGIQYLPHVLGDKQKSNQIVKEIETAIRRADSIVRGLLDFSRISKLEIVTESLNSIVYNSLVLLQRQMDENKIKLVTDYDKDAPYVDVDVGKMDQAFTNIIMNAIHVMPDGGKLTVRIYKDKMAGYGQNIGRRAGDTFKIGETAAVVEIEDTGCGIPDDIIDKIFEPFFTTRRGKGGTGLGLSMVKNIIDMHDGAIYIENKKDLKGARVTIILKLHSKA
ncbi:MAG TPA: PAS domain S-box protein [Candidatus Omnitrophica bacterium]|nr:PAS domain S-box protein [Candidatus Omnitrophota bacterium]